MKSEDKNAGVKEVLQIFIQVTGEHSSKEAVKKKSAHMKEKSKRHSAGTQRLKEVVLALLFAGRERRGKKIS